MYREKIITFFGRESEERFLHAAGKIIDTMTANAGLFPNLSVSLTQVTAERDAFPLIFNSVNF